MRSLLAVAACIAMSLGATSCNDSKNVNVVGSNAPRVSAPADWMRLDGGTVLARLLDESGLTEEPTVFTHATACGGPCLDTTELIAVFDRPGTLQEDNLAEIRAMTFDGLSQGFMGQEAIRDGYIMNVWATTPGGGPGIMFVVAPMPSP
jgi:hypothetical protein